MEAFNPLERIVNTATSPALRERAADILASTAVSPLDKDATLLGYILEKTGIRLSEETGHPLEAEVDEWDRAHLGDLVYSLPSLLANPGADKKLQFLIRHSIRKDLVPALTRVSDANPYTKYNVAFMQALSRAGFSVDDWLSHGEHLRYSRTQPGDDVLRHTEGGSPSSRTFRFIEWTRDFRREFAIGNYSTCCIAVGPQESPRYQDVLLDYFLDLSIKALLINEQVDGRWRPVGQHYLVPCTNENGNPDRVVAITATELQSPLYRQANTTKGRGLVPALVAPFEGANGLVAEFGADALFVGDRFAEYGAFSRHVQEVAGNLVATLKQRKSQMNDQYKRLKSIAQDAETNAFLNPEGLARYEELKERKSAIAADITTVNELRDRICTGRKLSLRKVGLHDAFETGLEYTGTNYLDLFNIHDGNMNGMRFARHNVPKAVEGHVLESGQLRQMAEIIDVLRSQYVGPRKAR